MGALFLGTLPSTLHSAEGVQKNKATPTLSEEAKSPKASSDDLTKEKKMQEGPTGFTLWRVISGVIEWIIGAVVFILLFEIIKSDRFKTPVSRWFGSRSWVYKLLISYNEPGAVSFLGIAIAALLAYTFIPIKSLCGLKVVDKSGEEASWRKRMVRNLSKFWVLVSLAAVFALGLEFFGYTDNACSSALFVSLIVGVLILLADFILIWKTKRKQTVLDYLLDINVADKEAAAPLAPAQEQPKSEQRVA